MLYELVEETKKLGEKLEKIKEILDISSKQNAIKILETEVSHSEFWKDQLNAQEKMRKLSDLKKQIEEFYIIQSKYDDFSTLVNISKDDISLDNELTREMEVLKKAIMQLELQHILHGKYDKNSAIVTIHPGVGGTESQDWASMLFRMYTRWAEQKGFEVAILDFLAGDEAGIKSVTFLVKGSYSYGYLKAEKGVHRLVRISPFDANKRRHTSFASLGVMPEIDDDAEIAIKEEELRIDTYRASGAGGQHVNKTDSAVRITHLPTGIVAQCQNERSQFKNKATAMKILKGRLAEYYDEIKQQEIDKIRGEKKDIGWGSQIRSYVFHPYNLVKDHRTGVEKTSLDAVMNGDLDDFISAYLHQRIKD